MAWSRGDTRHVPEYAREEPKTRASAFFFLLVTTSSENSDKGKRLLPRLSGRLALQKSGIPTLSDKVLGGMRVSMGLSQLASAPALTTIESIRNHEKAIEHSCTDPEYKFLLGRYPYLIGISYCGYVMIKAQIFALAKSEIYFSAAVRHWTELTFIGKDNVECITYLLRTMKR